MRRTFLILLVCLVCSASFAQQSLSKYEYWFDQETSTIGALDGSSSQEHKLSIDTQHLSSGLHSFYYRAQDTDGNWSPLGSWLFMVKELPKNGTIKVVQGEYWIDNLYNRRTVMEIVDDNTGSSQYSMTNGTICFIQELATQISPNTITGPAGTAIPVIATLSNIDPVLYGKAADVIIVVSPISNPNIQIRYKGTTIEGIFAYFSQRNCVYLLADTP